MRPLRHDSFRELQLSAEPARPGPLLRRRVRLKGSAVAALLGFVIGSASAFSGGSPICHTDQIIGCPMGFPVPDGAGIFSIVPDVAGYRIVWRETGSPVWQHRRDVGMVTRVVMTGLSKDNLIFGVQAVDRDGHASLAAFPLPLSR